MSEYRSDDQTIGYCPKCGQQLSNLTVGLRGYCDLHGWTYANFVTASGNPRSPKEG